MSMGIGLLVSQDMYEQPTVLLLNFGGLGMALCCVVA